MATLVDYVPHPEGGEQGCVLEVSTRWGSRLRWWRSGNPSSRASMLARFWPLGPWRRLVDERHREESAGASPPLGLHIVYRRQAEGLPKNSGILAGPKKIGRHLSVPRSQSARRSSSRSRRFFVKTRRSLETTAFSSFRDDCQKRNTLHPLDLSKRFIFRSRR